MKKNEILRRIPKIDEVLKEHLISDYFGIVGRETVTTAAREAIDELRKGILSLGEDALEAFDITKLEVSSIVDSIIEKVDDMEQNNLYPLINATGTILHTNLGRAPLCKDAVDNVAAVSRGYSNLEYDVKAGKRGSRHSIIEDLIVELTGAEAAMMVNNNASATMIVLSSMAAGKEVIVSRGELVEIGGAFRIPDIMEQSGAKLRDIGTTNKTKPSDYVKNIDHEMTGALMKVHTSNYRIMGFTEEASLEDLVEIGKEYDLPVIFDMGNGLMLDLAEYGLDEPNVPASLATGIDVMLFSGDKLLGGPQGGIIVGKKKYIDKMKKHPLARALRVDKMTFAAMEATLKKYRDEEIAKRDIPVVHMITEPKDSLLGRATELAQMINDRTDKVKAEVVAVDDQIGGGSAPMVYLPGYGVAITSDSMSANSIERALRKNETPIVARIQDEHLLLCIRTVLPGEAEVIADAFRAM